MNIVTANEFATLILVCFKSQKQPKDEADHLLSQSFYLWFLWSSRRTPTLEMNTHYPNLLVWYDQRRGQTSNLSNRIGTPK